MIAVLNNGVTPEQIENLIIQIKQMGLDVHISQGHDFTVLGLIGDTSHVDMDIINSLEFVDAVKRVSTPFKQVCKTHNSDRKIIDVNGVKIGGGHFAMIAGPCSVESEDQLISIAMSVKECGANILRGGAFKPRTSPYTFQGLKDEGIRLLSVAKKVTGLPVISEIVSARSIGLFEDVDIIQVGARNMQNFDLLRELGKSNKPILLKRGLCNTLQELLMSAEYIMSEGNDKIILCERGIRTYETYTRNTLDLSAVPALHELTNLPVIVDPSHATGKASLVPSMALAAAACGADGLMIEVHNTPSCALCDGVQSITPDQFDDLSKSVSKILTAIT